MKNILLGTIIFFMVLFFGTLVMYLGSGITRDIQYSEYLIGKKVVIKTDTMIVTSYSRFNNTYTLDNWLVVDGEFCKTKVINK